MDDAFHGKAVAADRGATRLGERASAVGPRVGEVDQAGVPLGRRRYRRDGNAGLGRSRGDIRLKSSCRVPRLRSTSNPRRLARFRAGSCRWGCDETTGPRICQGSCRWIATTPTRSAECSTSTLNLPSAGSWNSMRRSIAGFVPCRPPARGRLPVDLPRRQEPERGRRRFENHFRPRQPPASRGPGHARRRPPRPRRKGRVSSFAISCQCRVLCFLELICIHSWSLIERNSSDART